MVLVYSLTTTQDWLQYNPHRHLPLSLGWRGDRASEEVEGKRFNINFWLQIWDPEEREERPLSYLYPDSAETNRFHEILPIPEEKKKSRICLIHCLPFSFVFS